MAIERKKFEEKCMDIIEEITSIDPKQDRQGAIALAKNMLEKAKESGNPVAIGIYARVVKEFEISTDEEYNQLRDQIFG